MITVNKIELKHTTELMNSSDYRERFVAEYLQTKIRYEKLKTFNTHIRAAEVSPNVNEPKHDCPYYVLEGQQNLMGQYLHHLEIRAVIEGIDLETSLQKLIQKVNYESGCDKTCCEMVPLTGKC